MLYALEGYIIPNEWKHNKLLKNKDKETIAMCYARGKYTSKE